MDPTAAQSAAHAELRAGMLAYALRFEGLSARDQVELKARDAAHEAAKAVGVDEATADAVIKPLIRRLRGYHQANEYLRTRRPPVTGLAAKVQAALDHLMATDPTGPGGVPESRTMLYDRGGHEITVADVRELLVEHYELLKLLGAIVDPLPCQHEYAGGCAVHGYFTGEEESVRCAHGEAMDVLAAAGLGLSDDEQTENEL